MKSSEREAEAQELRPTKNGSRGRPRERGTVAVSTLGQEEGEEGMEAAAAVAEDTADTADKTGREDGDEDRDGRIGQAPWCTVSCFEMVIDNDYFFRLGDVVTASRARRGGWVRLPDPSPAAAAGIPTWGGRCSSTRGMWPM